MIRNNFLNTNILSNKQLIANNQKVCTNVDTAPPVAKTTPTEPEGSKETIIPTTTSKDAASNAIDDYISTSVQTSSNYTKLYRKTVLINKYGLTEKDIAKYFEKRLGLYRLDSTNISKDFPGIKIATPEELKTAIECGVDSIKNEDSLQDNLESLSDCKIPKLEIQAELEEFFNILKKDLNSKGFSFDYINNILNFTFTKTLNSAKDTISPKEFATEILNKFNEITQETNLVYMKTIGLGKNKHEVNFFSSNDKISVTTLNLNDRKIEKEGNLQAQFFIYILEEAIKNLNLTSDESYIFKQRVFDAIAKKIGGYDKGNSKIIFNKLTTLDTNKDGSWLDEFNKIVQDEASKINANVDRNPETIDAKELTDWLGRLSPEDFLEDIDDLLLSDDGGIRKFAQIINETIDKFKAHDSYEKNQLVGYIFRLLNEAANKGSSKTLRKASLERLNNRNIFKKLENIVNSDKLELLYQLDCDGNIGDFKQGNTGDCWLLTGLISLNATSQGRQILKESLTFNSDNSITVNFKGVGVSYTITAEEILEAQAESERFEGAYSDGDNDVLVFELAVEKLRRDIAAGKIDLPISGKYSTTSESDSGKAGEGISGGFTEQFVYFLTGKKANKISALDLALEKNRIKDFFNKYYNDFQNGTIALSFSIVGIEHKATTIDGKELNINLSDKKLGHALSIVAMTNNTVTIVNPWDSKIEYTLTWEEFAKLGVSSLIAMPLT